MNLSIRRRQIDRGMAALSHATEQAAGEAFCLVSAKQSEADAQNALKIVQEAAESVQNVAMKQVAAVVTRCLRTVFGEDASTFELRFRQSRGKTEADLVLVRDGVEMAEPLDQSSGGQVEVAALALRIVTIMMGMPQKRRVLFCDEPMRSLHGDEYRERLAAMLPMLAKELGFQLIISSGLSWLRIGKVIQLENNQ